MGLEFWLQYSKTSLFRFPVNPSEVSLGSIGRNNEVVEVARLGEVSIFGTEKLEEVTFSSFFPRDYNPTYCEYAKIRTPLWYHNTIKRWANYEAPIRIIIGEDSKDDGYINMLCTVSDYKITEKGGEVGDIYFDITLKEYKAVGSQTVKRVTGNNVQKGKKDRPAGKPQATSYIVKKGDTLSKIAQREMGSQSLWRKLYEANKKTIGPDSDKIKVGQKLVIPK